MGRRPNLDIAVCDDCASGGCTHRPGVLAENNGLLSLPLSSRGGEGNGVAASQYQDASKVQAPNPPPRPAGCACQSPGFQSALSSFAGPFRLLPTAIVPRFKVRGSRLDVRCSLPDGPFPPSALCPLPSLYGSLGVARGKPVVCSVPCSVLCFGVALYKLATRPVQARIKPVPSRVVDRRPASSFKVRLPARPAGSSAPARAGS